MTRRKSYQLGSVQLHSGRWTLRIREIDHTTGKWKMRRYVLGNFKDKKDALEVADPIIKAINERNKTGPLKVEANITFKAFIESYWQVYAVRRKLQVSTIDHRNWLLDLHILPYFGSMLMKDVQPSDISNFFQMKAKSKKNYSNNTMMSFYGFLRVAFDLAEQYDVIDKSPVRPKLHKPELVKVEKPTLSASQIREVMTCLTNEQERLFILLLAVTGMRFGECLALRWMDFNSQTFELSINHTLYRGKLKDPKTKGSKAKIRLASQIAALLSAHQVTSTFPEKDDYIFSREDGAPLESTTIREHLYIAMDKAGIQRVKGKHGMHIFRHSAGTLLYEKSRDLKLVQGTLRHRDISTTSDIYVHVGEEVLNEGSEILTGEILGSSAHFVTTKSEMVS